MVELANRLGKPGGVGNLDFPLLVHRPERAPDGDRLLIGGKRVGDPFGKILS